MPSERIYTIRGKNPAGITHSKIQLSSFDPTQQYVIVEFKIMPATDLTLGSVATDCYGTVSMGKNNNIDPTEPDFTNQNEIAWAHHALWQNGTALPGSESIVSSNFECNDEKIFAYDIWMHTKDVMDNCDINYFLKIKRYNTTDVAGSIASLRQNQYNDQENQ